MLNMRKRILSIIVFFSVCFSMSLTCFTQEQGITQGAAATAAEAGLIGDLNGDGSIDALDNSLMKQVLLGTITDLPVQDDLYAADLDGDGQISALDLSLMKQYLLGLIAKFPKNPQPSTPTVIMPLGDSITDGLVVPGGYRIKLWKSITDNGQKVDFVGSLSNGPAELGDKNHEGHSGWRIDQLDTNINSWMTTYKPKIVLLHIGTNDVAQNTDLANAPARLGTLIDKICAKLPAGGKLYVATIVPLGMGDLNNKVKDYNSKIPGIVQSKVSQGKPVYMVDMYSALTTADLADGVHPNRTGYDKMADVWYKAISNDLSK
ncbi:xyloglucanase Xgh74A precursor [Ruminiclostridium hungatei]|uniref:cellulase n=1 Tax=Ruminiclostridium hungatei TaxID=48256 RepID=A0A1V4SLH4_RUMHU|nr:GDSL-type esterase/lipase family protein [Ruminiclostridium hungatei]OPX44081.1 xyloglucanase Xgh74A precursor [Ruminiclostridium hungatei]